MEDPYHEARRPSFTAPGSFLLLGGSKRPRQEIEDEEEDEDMRLMPYKRRRRNEDADTVMRPVDLSRDLVDQVHEEATLPTPRSSWTVGCRNALGLAPRRRLAASPDNVLDMPAANDEDDDYMDEEGVVEFRPLAQLHSFLHHAAPHGSDERPTAAGSSAEPPTFFSIPRHQPRRPLRWGRILLCLLSLLAFAKGASFLLTPSATAPRLHPHSIPPARGGELTDLTLRDFLQNEDGFSLAMAPAFFGFYGYFGTLAAWEEASLLGGLQQVAGASAGAMAAILLAAGVSPIRAADLCAQVDLADFADFPGALAAFRGDRFEGIMQDMLARECAEPCCSLLLEDAILPVAVSAFDLQSMAGQILTTGSMARAARASATFPLLFQPVGWDDGVVDYTLIDGGVTDWHGVAGLVEQRQLSPGRVVNLKINEFFGSPPAPSEIDGSTHVLSLSILHLPGCGPWAMDFGPIAVEGARRAMKASLDLPLYRGKEENHYELHIDASSFCDYTTTDAKR
jgi:hypothetical protein